MGTYCTTSSLETLWGGASFTDLTSTADAMITQAENEINKMLSKRYDMSAAIFQTSTSVPPMVTTLCEWLSLGYLYEITARGSVDAYARADRFINKAHENIEGILENKYDLVDSDGDPLADDGTQFTILSNQTDYAPTFNEDSDLNWEVDPDKIDDIGDGRL